MESKHEKFCQSCAMPLKDNNLGTEKNKKDLSLKYCNLCYANGEFTNKDITYDEMKRLGIEGLKKESMFFLKKRFFIWSYPSMLKKTERWSSK